MCASDDPSPAGTSAQHAQEACAALLDRLVRLALERHGRESALERTVEL